MAHIHTKPGQHDHTASAFIIRTDFPEPKLMLHLHKNLNTLLQFGGHVELNENPWQAITHEVREESGYDLDQLKILQPKLRLTDLKSSAVAHPVPVSYNTHALGSDRDHFHTDSSYAFITDQKPRHAANEGESSDIRFYTRDELAALPPDKVWEDVCTIGLFIFDKLLDEWEQVPAATI